MTVFDIRPSAKGLEWHYSQERSGEPFSSSETYSSMSSVYKMVCLEVWRARMIKNSGKA